jgi:hypothetical protein
LPSECSSTGFIEIDKPDNDDNTDSSFSSSSLCSCYLTHKSIWHSVRRSSSCVNQKVYALYNASETGQVFFHLIVLIRSEPRKMNRGTKAMIYPSIIFGIGS